jgi:ATP-binding cassette subfamily B protein
MAYRAKLVIYLTLLSGAALAGVGVPIAIKRLIDGVLSTRHPGTILVIGLIVLALGLINAAGTAAGQALGSLIGVQMIFDMRMRLYRHMNELPLSFFARSQSGALLSRFNNDVIEAQGLVQAMFGSAAFNAITLSAAVVTMFALSPLITLIVLGTWPLMVVPVRIIGRQVRKLAREQAAESSRMNSRLSERLNVSGALLRLLFGHQRVDTDRFEQRAAALRDVVGARNITFAKGAMVLGGVGVLANALVYLVGGLSAVRGALSVGTVVAMAALVKLAYDPLVSFMTSGVNVYGGLVAFERVYEILDFRPAIADPPDPVRLTRPVTTAQFREVWFRHPDVAESTLPSLVDEAQDRPGEGRAWALQAITFTARRETTTAIVGPTGAGKSTLTALVSRLYDPVRGMIAINGIDLRNLSLDDIRAAVGVVTQDAYMINDTFASNLRLARPDASDDDLLEACRNACLSDLIERLPEGLGTIMGDRGYRLSGGERQRAALARVFLKDPDILVLDEATAHLDGPTEQAIRAALTGMFSDRTLLVVAHRLSTVRHADEILVMNLGQIVERGTHAELLATGTLYPKLYSDGLAWAPESAIAQP